MTEGGREGERDARRERGMQGGRGKMQGGREESIGGKKGRSETVSRRNRESKGKEEVKKEDWKREKRRRGK